jgi:hypothetical protein
MSQEPQVDGEIKTEEAGQEGEASNAGDTPNQVTEEEAPPLSEENPEAPLESDEDPEVSEGSPDDGEPVSGSEEVVQEGSTKDSDAVEDAPDTSAAASPAVPSKPKSLPSTPEGVLEALTKLREDVGQISELSSEEGNIVEAFCLAFLKLMESLARSLPVDAEALPRRLRGVERANVIPQGELVVLHRGGRMESIDLSLQENRDLLIDVVSNVLPKFNSLIEERRMRIERRIAFLADVTRELQNIADSVTLA